ncbi:MAG: HAD family hydrolase [Myxococcota bacterium]|nr:HAD family hydrolase [Myxococcota bacterium]
MTLRIAVWSGPRNISTALMRSWENRVDCAVIDEPLYAHYLHRTGLPHPGAAAVIQSQPTDWRQVTESLAGSPPCGSAVWYQKHMTQHLLPHIGRDWMAGLEHVFLIRDPVQVAASYSRARPEFNLEDLGLPQQAEIFRYVTEELGQAPRVLDSRDVLTNPEGMLRALCQSLNLSFSQRMLRWPTGPRESDGVWAPHWYTAVWNSTGFEPYRPRPRDLTAAAQSIADQGRHHYEALYSVRMQA